MIRVMMVMVMVLVMVVMNDDGDYGNVMLVVRW